jgi:RNA polymerase sigma-70 factor (ECF subfamily)
MTPDSARATSAVIDFAGLYRSHAPDLRRFALFLSGDAALADDLVSEAFIRVWGARDRVELPTVRAYLFTIVRNLFLHHVRDRRANVAVDARVVDRHPGPEQLAMDRSDLRVVLSALGALPEIDRAAVLMRADGRMSYEEIGAVLGISSGAAKVKVHRARLKLAEARLRSASPASRTERIS